MQSSCGCDRHTISTHALREEGDQVGYHLDGGVILISTHALREEGDSKCAIK